MIAVVGWGNIRYYHQPHCLTGKTLRTTELADFLGKIQWFIKFWERTGCGFCGKALDFCFVDWELCDFSLLHQWGTWPSLLLDSGTFVHLEFQKVKCPMSCPEKSWRADSTTVHFPPSPPPLVTLYHVMFCLNANSVINSDNNHTELYCRLPPQVLFACLCNWQIFILFQSRCRKPASLVHREPATNWSTECSFSSTWGSWTSEGTSKKCVIIRGVGVGDVL